MDEPPKGPRALAFGRVGPVLAGCSRKLIAAASVLPADYRGTIRHARRLGGFEFPTRTGIRSAMPT